MADILLKYLPADGHRIHTIEAELKSARLSLSRAQEQPHPNQRKNQINTPTFGNIVLVLWSQNSAKNRKFQRQVEQIIERDIYIPIIIDEAHIPLWLRKNQAYDLAQGSQLKDLPAWKQMMDFIMPLAETKGGPSLFDRTTPYKSEYLNQLSARSFYQQDKEVDELQTVSSIGPSPHRSDNGQISDPQNWLPKKDAPRAAFAAIAVIATLTAALATLFFLSTPNHQWQVAEPNDAPQKPSQTGLPVETASIKATEQLTPTRASFIGAIQRQTTKAQSLARIASQNADQAAQKARTNGKGHGIKQYKNGARYEGELSWGKRHGHGIYHYPSGSRYHGAFQNNTKHGHGIYHFSRGDIYEGQFKKGLLSGHGIYQYSDGTSLVGEFVDGQLHGNGFKHTSQNSISQLGIWKANKFLSTLDD